MKTTLFSLLSCLIFVFLGFAQDDTVWEIKSGITPTFVDFSNNDKYLILENENAYEVWNTQTKQKIVGNLYRNKLGRSFSGVYVSEGSAYLLFENEEVFLQIDYTINFTKVDAFDLTTGEKIWSLDNLDMGITDVEALYQIVSNAQRFVQNEEQLGNATFTAATGVKTTNANNSVPVSYVGHDKTIQKLINYLPYKNAITVNGKKSLQLLDLKTGKIIWEQPELQGGLGEIFYEPTHDLLIAIRVNNTQIDHILSKPEVQALDADTGDLVWNISYTGHFTPNTAFVVEDILVLPYFGIELIDVKTGEEIESKLKESMQKSRKMYRNMSVMGSSTEGLGENGSYPILDENNIIHYVTGFRKSEHLDPDGGKKAYFKISALTGEFINIQEEVAKTMNRVIQEEFTEEFLYLKFSKGLSNTYMLALDTKTGEVVFETDKVKNRLGTDFDPFLLNNNRIIDFSSKGIHFYDAQTGKEYKVTSYKKVGVGKFRNQFIFDEGMILLGTKGVAIVDNNGEVKITFDDMDEVRDVRIGEHIWLIQKDRLISLTTNPIEIIKDVKLQKNEKIHFSPSGAFTLKVDTGTNTVRAF